MQGFLNPLKVVYSHSKTPGSVKSTSRYIPQTPDRILDAPDIIDDYCKLVFMLPSWRLHSSGMLCSVDWYVQSTLYIIPKQQRSNLHCDGSLKKHGISSHECFIHITVIHIITLTVCVLKIFN